MITEDRCLIIEHKTDYVFIMSEIDNDRILLTLSCNVGLTIEGFFAVRSYQVYPKLTCRSGTITDTCTHVRWEFVRAKLLVEKLVYWPAGVIRHTQLLNGSPQLSLMQSCLLQMWPSSAIISGGSRKGRTADVRPPPCDPICVSEHFILWRVAN